MGLRGYSRAQLEQARADAQQYARITAAFPVTDTSTENLKVTVVEFRRIAERSASPERALLHVSRVLGKYPQFELESLRWTVAKAAELSTTAPKPQTERAEAAEPGVLVEITGRVNATQRNDYRGIT